MKNILTAFIFISLFAFTSVQAEIYCHTPRFKRAMKISKNSVTFLNGEEFSYGRKIASSRTARTRTKGLGFKKILKLDGNKLTIVVKNTKEFSEVDDYMTIRSRKGHEVIYPLICMNK